MLLLRRLNLPLHLTARYSRCGFPLDSVATTAQLARGWWVLGRRGCPLESVVAPICREAGGRVATNVLVRDPDIAELVAGGGRRVEGVADGLPLIGGASWPRTPPLSAPSTQTVSHVAPTWMEWPWTQRTEVPRVGWALVAPGGAGLHR